MEKIKKFKAEKYWNKITAVNVDRETESSVFIDGSKSNKISNYTGYFDTHEEAKKWLLDDVTAELNAAHKQVARLEQQLQGIQNL